MKTLLLLLLVFPVLISAQIPDAPADWNEWAKWAEKIQPVTDDQGHGPDIGSDEWANALAKRLKVMDAEGHGPDVGSKEWRQAVEKKLMEKVAPAAAKHRELLSSHDTLARFVGLKDHKCRGLTSLCPDRCGESGKIATFDIVKYKHFEKPGEFGDPQQQQFMVLIEDNMKNAKVPVEIRDAILALKPGALVDLKWNHDYVTQGGSKFPERVIVKLAPLADGDQETAAPLVGGYAAADVASADVRKAAAFAVREKQADSAGLALAGITDAQTQIVAGRNFKLRLKVTVDGVEKQAEAIIYQDLGRNMSLTSWTWK